MVEQLRGLTTFTANFSSSHTSMITEHCKKFVPAILNKSTVSNEHQIVLNSFLRLLSKHNLTLNSLNSVSECITILTRLIRYTNESNFTIAINPDIYSPVHSRSLIVFVVLIACVSFVSILGNLCLAKVLYSKRHRLIQTDRIVLCLALSELCLVLVDSPTEIYRFLSPSFTEEWLCPFHTFFEALFSSCIIFYHLLGAFDRYVYIHGHTSSQTSFWSKWSRRISTQSGSRILLILPIICSLPLAICNSFNTDILHRSSTNKICIVQYTHGILIGLLTIFYLLPLLFSFFLHIKLVYFIRTRHNQYYLTSEAYTLPMKRNIQSKERPNKDKLEQHDRLLLKPNNSSHGRPVINNTETIGATISTTTTMAIKKSVPLNSNNSSNSSQSSRSSTGTVTTHNPSPIVLYKINSQANANANRTVLLLILLLSFYVFCWAPYNVYTWYHAYFLTQSSSSSNRMINNNHTSLNDSNVKVFMSVSDNLHADLRRIIYINYSLYLLSMISMCFSFIFYFSLNKQARHEFSRFIGCICPLTIRNDKFRPKNIKQTKPLQDRSRYPNQYFYKNDRIQKSPSSILDDRYNHLKQINDLEKGTPKRRALNYGCQIQCCP